MKDWYTEKRVSRSIFGSILEYEYLYLNGELDIDACDKATRLIRVCDAFNIPVVTLVNTKGFKVTTFNS